MTSAMLTRYTAYRFRAYPTAEQAMALERWQHAQRALWNAANAQRMERLRRDGYDTMRQRRWLTAFDQNKELTLCRAEFSWLREVPCSAQRNMLSYLDMAWKRFFEKKSGLPRFKRRLTCDVLPMSFSSRECTIISRRRVRMPKLGDVRVHGHRPIIGEPIQVSLTRDVDNWFVAVTCKIVECHPTAPSGNPIGLDFGVVNILADSDGRLVKSARCFENARQKLSKLQRALARRRPKRGQTASNNYKKILRKVALVYLGTRRQRADVLHVLSNRYAKSHGTVVIEDLRVKSMSASARGTVDNPGSRLRQKSGLNRAILDIGWNQLRLQLVYKCVRSGSRLITVDANNTSLTCSACGYRDSANRVSQSHFSCILCSHGENADVNAAKNILARGIGHAGATTASVCGGQYVSRPMKQKKAHASASCKRALT